MCGLPLFLVFLPVSFTLFYVYVPTHGWGSGNWLQAEISHLWLCNSPGPSPFKIRKNQMKICVWFLVCWHFYWSLHRPLDLFPHKKPITLLLHNRWILLFNPFKLLLALQIYCTSFWINSWCCFKAQCYRDHYSLRNHHFFKIKQVRAPQVTSKTFKHTVKLF